MQRADLEHIIRAAGAIVDAKVLVIVGSQAVLEIRNENTKGYTCSCLEVHDLAVSKLVAGREKDFDFVVNLLRHRMIEADKAVALAGKLPVPGEQQALLIDRLRRL